MSKGSISKKKKSGALKMHKENEKEEEVKEIFPPIQDTLGICYQITILILYNINSRLVPFLKFIYVSVQISEWFCFYY
jgi:uncharacterized membrane protein SirB2